MFFELYLYKKPNMVILKIAENKLYKIIEESIRKQLLEDIDNDKPVEEFDEDNQPTEESCMNIENGWYQGLIPQSFPYFGDCKNTVDKDKMWDATQMFHVINEALLVPVKDVLGNLEDGDRKIPSIFKREIKKANLDDLTSVSAAINVYQRILIIYLSNIDTHFFFDVKN